MSIASWTSPRVSARTFPISRVMSRASSSLSTRQDRAGVVEDLGAPRRRQVSPRRVGLPGRCDGGVDVLAAARRENTDEIVDVRGIPILDRTARRRGQPLAADEVAGELDRDLGAHPPVPGDAGGRTASSGFGGVIGRFGASSIRGGAESGRAAASFGITTRPWIWAPSAMTMRGACTLPCTRPDASSSARSDRDDLSVDAAADDDGLGLDVPLDLGADRDDDLPIDPDLPFDPAVDQDVLVSGEVPDELDLRPDHGRGRHPGRRGGRVAGRGRGGAFGGRRGWMRLRVETGQGEGGYPVCQKKPLGRSSRKKVSIAPPGEAEPPFLRGIRSIRGKDWSGQRGSNPRHPAWEADALPAELCPRGRPKYSESARTPATRGARSRPRATISRAGGGDPRAAATSTRVAAAGSSRTGAR